MRKIIAGKQHSLDQPVPGKTYDLYKIQELQNSESTWLYLENPTNGKAI